MGYKIFISCLIFVISFCKEDSKNSTTFSNQDSSLPTMQNIKNIIIEPRIKTSLLESARKLGYSSVVDWYGNVLQRISEDELDFYYKIHKPKDIQLDIDFISRFRREIHERIAWKKIFIESKIDFSKITPLNVTLPNSALENSPFLGSKNPKVQIVEFSDFACYYCAKSQDIKRKLLAKYGREIQWSFKNFPIISRENESFWAHVALGCVEK
ncbi:MAG: DsbA family protein, partial [Leptospiraceae bacterium]|nr:DsbA family protein [Leptospiraceae bacterium]